MARTPDRPKLLAAKLLAIREQIDASQSQFAKLLNFDKDAARICEYENGVREPSLLTLLRYSKLARVSINVLVDDGLELFPKSDGFATRQRLHHAAVELTVGIAALDKVVSHLLSVGEALRAILDEATAADAPDE